MTIRVFRALTAAAYFVMGLATQGQEIQPDEVLKQKLEQRKTLDAGVWKQERRAQFYEQRIVQMWDSIRQSPQKFEVLAKLPFKELLVSGESAAAPIGPGIQLLEFKGALASFSAASFRARLAELTQEGFILVQSEWHHQAFAFDESSKRATSDVRFSLHVTQDKKQLRLMISGLLHISWEAMSEPNQVPNPQRIEVRDLSILERTGEPAFLKVTEIDARKLNSRVLSVQPLIAYDLNGDGLSEVILGGVNLVHWNLGGGRFKRAPLLRDWPGEISESALVADFNGDGWVDFLCITAKERAPVLFAGNEQGLFLEPGVRAAAVRTENPSVLTAGDIDGDGDLDCWLTQYRPPYLQGQMPTPFYDANDGFPSFLLLNRGDGQFDEVTEERGLLRKRHRRTYSASFVDLDQDHDLDLLVVSDFAGVDLYRNDGRGFFTDATEQWIEEGHNFGMAHTFGDYDRDGRLDFYVIGMSSTTARRLDAMKLGRSGFEEHRAMRSVMGFGNRMYLNRGAKYEEPDFRFQVARTGWSWGCSTFDFENDGDQDLYVANGHISGASAQDYCSTFWCHDLYDANSRPDLVTQELLNISQSPVRDRTISWNGFEKNALLMNRDGKGFSDIGFLMDVALANDCRGVVSDDLNGDGRMDLLVVEEWSQAASKKGQILHVYANESPPGNHWIGFRLKEQGRQGHAIGATVTLRSGQRTQVDQIVVGDSFFSQHAPVAHFGLGEGTVVDEVEIRWPSGRSTVLKKPAIDQYHTINPDR